MVDELVDLCALRFAVGYEDLAEGAFDDVNLLEFGVRGDDDAFEIG